MGQAVHLPFQTSTPKPLLPIACIVSSSRRFHSGQAGRAATPFGTRVDAAGLRSNDPGREGERNPVRLARLDGLVHQATVCARHGWGWGMAELGEPAVYQPGVCCIACLRYRDRKHRIIEKSPLLCREMAAVRVLLPAPGWPALLLTSGKSSTTCRSRTEGRVLARGAQESRLTDAPELARA